jgi:hypothetical protein
MMSMTITHTPGEWDGTFTVLVREFARDLLLDGPVPGVSINGGPPRLLVGYDAEQDWLVFDENQVLDASADIDEIAVA